MLYKKLYVYKTALRERAIRHQSTAPGRRDEIFSIRSIRSLKSQLVNQDSSISLIASALERPSNHSGSKQTKPTKEQAA